MSCLSVLEELTRQPHPGGGAALPLRTLLTFPFSCEDTLWQAGFLHELEAEFRAPLDAKVDARASTTSDAFNAIAEPRRRRREILTYLAKRERSVGDIAASLRLEQPSVSKHLRVLRDVGFVQVRRAGGRLQN
jgi:DNA-binding transcriptional ArsR family regulator